MNLHEEIIEQRNFGFTYSEIVRNLIHKGYAPDEITKELQESYKEREINARNKNPVLYNKFFPLAVLILIYLIFFRFIPDDVVSEYNTLLAVIGSILFCAFTFITIARLAPSLLDKAPILVFVLSMLSLFVFGVVFISQNFDTEHKELKEFGVLGTARVIDGREFGGRRGKIASIKIRFITKKNETIVTKIDVAPSQFDLHYIDQEIAILYSSKNPNIVREIRSMHDLEAYKK